MTDDLESLRHELDELRAERAVTRALIAFAGAMDARDWETARALLTDDAEAELGEGPLVGADAIVAAIRRWLDHCGPTQHLLGNVTVDLDLDAGTARSTSAVHDLHLGTGDRADLTFATLGEYHDEWVSTPDGWQLRRRRKVSRAVVGSFDVFRRD